MVAGTWLLLLWKLWKVAPKIALALKWLTYSFLGKALLSFGLSFALNAIANAIDRRRNNNAEELNGLDLAPQAGALVPRQILIGEYATFGQIVYQNTYGSSNEYFEHVCLLNDWYSEGLTGVIINNQLFDLTVESSSGAKTVYTIDTLSSTDIKLTFYNGFQVAADSDLVTNSNPSGKWDTTAVGVGLTYVVMRIKYRKDSALFKGGIPQLKYIGKWSLLYDWRLDTTNGGSGSHRWDDFTTWEWSDNPVVGMYNYHRGFYHNDRLVIGQGVALADIIQASYTAAADIADQSVSLDAGGTEPRYRCCITLTASRDIQHSDALDSFRAAFAGYLYDYGGFYYVVAGANYSSQVTINDTDLDPESPVTLSMKRPRFQLGNVFYGNYLDPAAGYEPQTYTEQRDDTNVSEVGEEIAVSHELLNVPSQFQAERIARIRLREVNAQHTASIVLFSLRFFKYMPGDWITWRSLLWRIADRQVDLATGKVGWQLEGTASDVASWSTSDEGEVNLIPATITPGTQITTVSGFNLAAATITGTDGEKLPVVYATWTVPSDESVDVVVIEWYKDGDSKKYEVNAHPSKGTAGFVLGEAVPGETYKARASIRTTPYRAPTWTSEDSVSADADAIASTVIDDGITTPKIIDNAVTTLDYAFTSGSKTINGTDIVAQTLVMTRNADSEAGFWINFEIVEFTPSGNTPPFNLTCKLKREGTTLETRNLPIPCIDAAGVASNHHYGGMMNFAVVDDDNVSGSQTYTLEITGLSDWLGTPGSFTINVRNRFMSGFERRK